MLIPDHIPHTHTHTHTHMQSGSDLMSEPPECCICLDRFTSPASLPCGHCFCLGCVGEHWRILGAYQCPICRTFFPTRPQLETCPTLHAAAALTEDATVPFQSGEVPCDVCPAKRRAVKSCLRCMASFCATHLEPHYRNEDLGCHLLISVAKNLEEPVCGSHGKQLNSFCGSDQTCICAMCAQTEHRGHRIISINREARKKKDKLKRRVIKLQQVIQDRLGRVERVKLSSEASGGIRALGRSGAAVIGQLEEEISALQRKSAELEEQLSLTGDNNLRFLQGFLRNPSR